MQLLRKWFPLLALMLVLTHHTAQAYDGDLDSRFSSIGYRYLAFDLGDTNHDFSSQILVLPPNSRYMVVGFSCCDVSSNEMRVTLTRLLPDGTLDNSFGINGKIVTNISDSFPIVALDNKLNILIVSTGQNKIIRLLPDGNLDTSFGGDGIVDLPTGFISSSLALLPNGQPVIGGNFSGSNLAAVRLNLDGSLDTHFNSTGIAQTQVGTRGHAQSIALQSNGAVVVLGISDTRGSSSIFDLALARFTAAGLLDSSFHGDGKLLLPSSDLCGGLSVCQDNSSFKLAVRPSEHILIAGIAGDNISVVQLKPDGLYDGSFGTNGRVNLDYKDMVPASITRVATIGLQTDGKLVIAGSRFISSASLQEIALLRLKRDGSRDTTFSNPTYHHPGSVFYDFSGGSRSNILSSLAFDAGRLVATGYFPNSSGNLDIFVARLENDLIFANGMGD